MDTSRPRKPFVDSFREDLRKGFWVGAAGSCYHLKHGGRQAFLKNAPRICCSSVVFAGVYSAINYAMVSKRRKEEPFLDSAVAAAGASVVTFLPRGVRFAGASALVGGALGGVVLGGLKLVEIKARRR